MYVHMYVCTIRASLKRVQILHPFTFVDTMPRLTQCEVILTAVIYVHLTLPAYFKLPHLLHTFLEIKGYNFTYVCLTCVGLPSNHSSKTMCFT